MKLIVLLFLLMPQFTFAQDPTTTDLLERMKVLEKRLAELEGEQQLDVFRFHGQLATTYDDITLKETYPTARDHSNLDYYRLRFSWDAFADLDPTFKIYARITAKKFFNRWGTQGNIQGNSDMDMGHEYAGPGLFIEKAYFDYSPTHDFILSVGRLPTVEGGPSHLWDSQPRQGVYPMMNFNVPLDGIAATFLLDKYLQPEHQLAVRVLYTPLTTVYAGDTDPYINPPKQDTNGTTPTGNDTDTTFNAASTQVDYLAPKNTFSDQTNITWQYSILPNYPRYTGAGTSTLAYTGQINTLYLEFLGLWSSSFDFSASGTYSSLDTHGLISPGQGAGSTTDETHAYGFSTLLDARYRVGKWAFGIEYLNNSPLYFNFYSCDEDLIGFYRSPGIGQHIYVNRKLAEFLTLRFGYRQKNLSNYPIGAGNIQDTDREIKNFYVRLRADF